MQPSNEVSKLADHLFRHEAGKMVAILTRIFGLHNLELAEDVVQEAFAKAMKEWMFGIPDNPSAWLMQTAKNKTIDLIRRERYHQTFANEFTYLLKSEYTTSHTLNQLFLDHEIKDSQLRMIFACCHPDLGAQEQILLTLKTCSGFGIEEAASALLMKYDAAKKRLQRAKSTIVANGMSFEIPSGNALSHRLDNVLRVLYLMFNEGYKSSTQDEVIRKDICEEAMRLNILLTEHPLTNSPKTNALLALMCFQVARFDARIDENGDIVLLENQDRNKWNVRMIQLGEQYLDRSALGDLVSEYHLQAGIALTHLQAKTFESTNWAFIYELYAQLSFLSASPVILLNKAIVRAKLENPAAGLQEMMEIPKLEDLLTQNYLFAASIAQMHAEQQHYEEAKGYFDQALALAPTQAERRLLQKKRSMLSE